MPKQNDPELVPEQPRGELVVRPQHALAGINIETLLSKAIDAKSAVDVLERLQAMRREIHEENAKAEFDEAMSAFQEECPVITKGKGVPDRSGKIAYKYAPIESIEVQIRPLLRKHGFSHTFDTDTASAPGWVIAKCIVTHRAGHSRTSVAKFPLGTRTPIMSDTQVYAAALTFANRRALQNAYGLILAGEDLDGQTGKIKPQGPSSMAPQDGSLRALAQELWDVLKPVRGDKKDWVKANQWLWREDILDGAIPEEAPHLSAEQLKEVTQKAKQKLGH